jgi:hypothetical protein
MKMLKYILTIPTLALSCDYFLMEDIERGIGLGIVTLLITFLCLALNQEEKKEKDIYSL